MVAHRTARAGIRCDFGEPTGGLQQVFPGVDFKPTGRPWTSDGFGLDWDAYWNRPIEIVEISRGEVVAEVSARLPIVGGVFEIGIDDAVTINHRLSDGADTLVTFFRFSRGAYDGQRWVDLVAPEDATWESLHVLIGTSPNGGAN
jgi:hypothetical protein